MAIKKQSKALRVIWMFTGVIVIIGLIVLYAFPLLGY